MPSWRGRAATRSSASSACSCSACLREMTVCREIYSRPNPELRERGLHYQVQLLRAIKAGDAEKARTIMREHMEEAERYMLARAAMRGRAGRGQGA